jgi:hypothetical protein
MVTVGTPFTSPIRRGRSYITHRHVHNGTVWRLKTGRPGAICHSTLAPDLGLGSEDGAVVGQNGSQSDPQSHIISIQIGQEVAGSLL